MSKEKINQIIDEVYENFEKQCIPGTGKKMSKEEFVNICKINPEFSERLGLKIEERELVVEERVKWAYDRKLIDYVTMVENEILDKHNTPTKIITVKYNDKTIESYGN